MSIINNFKDRYIEKQREEMTLDQYLEGCKKDPTYYASAAERMLSAIGEPQLVKTADDPRLSRIFQNRTIKRYPAFADFYGMEEAIEAIVSYFKHAAQGLEEKKQILYLLGPVGGGKSSLAETLKKLMEKCPIYTLEAVNKTSGKREMSPVFESPLGLFDVDVHGDQMLADYGIPKRQLNTIMSPWAAKRLEEAKGDLSTFKVIRIYPSVLNRVGIAKTEPGDENNQDISTLVGKVDIRKLEAYSQDDSDAYSFNGGLCRANQGILEFVEMFKAPIKMLHPLLTATQEGNYNGTQGFGAIPFQGTILAHSNESEWSTFKGDRNNEAFLDRVCLIRVPYCLRIDEEIAIYEKLLRHSDLADKPCAPDTLKILAKFIVMTRIKDPDNSSLYSKAKIYNGEDLKDTDPKAKSIQDYRDGGGVTEGMDGISTRFAFKVLSKTFNFDDSEIAANPVHMIYVLQKAIESEQLQADVAAQYNGYIKGTLVPEYASFIGEEIQKAYLESYGEYGQNLFDRYINYADHWIQSKDYRDPETNENYDRESLNEELEAIEKPAGITNSKDFRNEVVNFVLRARAGNSGKSPKWISYEKLRKVIEAKMFSNTEDLLPVISFGAKATDDDKKKHSQFVQRMTECGYTEKQVRLLVEWHQRYKKHG